MSNLSYTEKNERRPRSFYNQVKFFMFIYPELSYYQFFTRGHSNQISAKQPPLANSATSAA